MLLIPKNTKYRKLHKQPIKGEASRGTTIAFGTYALKTIEPGRITSRQIEACRKAIRRHTKKTGKLWIRIFPHYSVVAKPAEVRMGKGKGDVSYWMCRVKPNRILFEIDGVPLDTAKKAFYSAGIKLPVLTKIIIKD